jgi:hypothetical protein
MKTVKIKLADGKIYPFAVGNGLSKLHKDLFIKTEVASQIRRKLTRYMEGLYDWRPTDKTSKDGEPVMELQRVTVPQFEALPAPQVAKDIGDMAAQFFDAFTAMVDASLQLAEVEAPTRQRLINEVITRADFDLIFNAIVLGESNVNEEDDNASKQPTS